MKLFSRNLIGRLRRVLTAGTLLMGICLFSIMMLVLSASAQKTSLQDLLLYMDESDGVEMTPVHALQQETQASPKNAVLEETQEKPAAGGGKSADQKMTPVTELEKPPVSKTPEKAGTPGQPAGKKLEKAPAKTPEKASPQPEKTATKEFPPLNPAPEGLPDEQPGKLPTLMPDPVAEEVAPPSPTQPRDGKSGKAEPQTATEDPLPDLAPFMSPDRLESTEDSSTNDDEKGKKEKQPKPKTVYKPLQAIVVFPVLRHGNDKAFGDVAILFATEFAQQLESKFPDTRIHNPVYSAEQLRIRGLGRIYNQMIDYYIKAGRPEPRALNFLLSELADDGLAIDRAIFVEADVDLHHQQRSFRPTDLFRKYHSGALPDEQRYYVMTRIVVYDTSSPHQPKIWAYSWSQPVKTTGLYNVTASVFQDSDSIVRFSRASRMMNRALLLASPRKVYMEGVTEIDTDLQGEVVENDSADKADTGARSGSGRLNDADRRTLERLLRQQ